ncbi:MAG: ATP-dependent DNA helicase RecG [Oscillospiraceae bacterium]
MANCLQQDIRCLKGIGERRAQLFKKLGVTSLDSLLRFYPRSYINMLDSLPIADAPLGIPCAVKAVVYSKSAPVRVRGGKTVFKVQCGDDTSALTVTYFNNKFAPAALTIGGEYIFYGRLSGGLLSREIINPIMLKPEKVVSLTPRYPLTEGLSSKIIENHMRMAYELCKESLTETLPQSLLDKYSLISRQRAIHDIHFPSSLEQASSAKSRLIFEELLTLSLGMHLMKSRNRSTTSAVLDKGDLNVFAKSLPYRLTRAQIRSIKEIASDLTKTNPMSRLLQGDVGSGKTVCAAACVYRAAASGYQSAVMAPTEILATQHAATFAKMLAPFGISVGLLTGSVKGKARIELLARIESGDCGLVIGTHALIAEAVHFKKLGFVIADEQHRFGVEQRSLLALKGEHPHLLVMSATPIPRTLALIIYGDLDISVLDEIPPGRTPVKTFLVNDTLRERYIGYVRKTVAAGHQAYIVCPLVEDSEALENTVSASDYKRELENNYLHGISVGLVHGRMKPAEKAAVMDAFTSGELSVLVSTTVIEVGVDVPNATLMIIENAERFGLSALHQLRGRVGRGSGESTCVLVSGSKSENAKSRLEIMTRTNDGFEIARHDLKLRGPGDFFGRRQHGLPELHIADLANDENVLYNASDAAKAILTDDEKLSRPEHKALKEQIKLMFAESEAAMN